ncbi:threonyl-tRNA synthetase [Podospora conica]|nr:threonyl-tRNA synthetase [Schizothecium conicum]
MLLLRASRWASHTLPRRPPRTVLSRLCSSHASTPTTPTTPTLLSAKHQQLGVQQELFTTSIYSPGSPIFLPNGTRIFNRLVDFLRRQYVHYGFDEVITPTIYKKDLWAKSGHLDNYADDMFTVTSTSPSRTDDAQEEGEYGLKPMNCPGHCLIFASKVRSYRDLPIRYADFSPLHRNEVSGALSGLTRVRRFHQDDGHIFCRPSQIEDEIAQTLAFVRETYRVLRMPSYRLALSTRPQDHYIGTLEDWAQAESSLRRALDASGEPWTLNEGDGAFYGPKIDVILTDRDGKEHQTATIQLDFQLPKRFELEYVAPAPEVEQRGETTTDAELLAVSGPVRPVMIHRAVLGSVERLMALLIEHHQGKWPLWLNPRQAILLTLNDHEATVQWAEHARDVLRSVDGPGAPPVMAVDVDDSARPLSQKIRQAKNKGYSLVGVIGPGEVEGGTVMVDFGDLPLPEGAPSRGKGSAKKSMTPEGLRGYMHEMIRAHQ